MAATTQRLEDALPIVTAHGVNTDKNITVGGSANFDMSGSTGTFKFPAGAVSNQKFSLISGSGATVTLTAAQSSSIVLFDRAAGIVFTLPVPVVGMNYTFLTTVSVTSNNATVITDSGATFVLGAVQSLTIASAVTFASLGNGTSHVKIQSNGTTTGGLQGGAYNFYAISTTQWVVEGLLVGSGTLATPFA